MRGGIIVKKILFGLADILGTIIIMVLPMLMSTVIIIATILTFIGYKLIKKSKRSK